MRSIRLRLGCLLLLASTVTTAASAQCAIDWSSGSGQPFLSGHVVCTLGWDPDGAGPLPQRLVVGGDGLNAGTGPADQLVTTWDGSAWSSLGPRPGTSGNVRALTTWNGALVAGGSFTGNGFSRVASWSGTAWQPLGTTFTEDVVALVPFNGDLVAIAWEQGGGVSQPYLRRWNGTAWSAMPMPPFLEQPKTATVFQGNLLIGGVAGSTGVLERWTGTTWLGTTFATSATFGSIDCCAVRSSLAVGGSDTLYVGGKFTSLGGATVSNIAKTTNATTWSGVGSGLPQTCLSLHARSSGLVDYTIVAVVLGSPTIAWRFTSTSGQWGSMTSEPLRSVTYFNGAYVGMKLNEPGATCLRWNGTQWLPVLGAGIDGVVTAATRVGNDIVIGGTFQSVPGGPANCIARWDGTAFQPLGSGVSGPSVDALITLDNGDVIAGGWFATAGGVTVNNVARWNGASWSALGSGTAGGTVKALCRLTNGDLVAGGQFQTAGGVPCANIARWNGSAWSPLGGGTSGDVLALAVRDSTLFVGGSFTTAGGITCNCVAQWNGSSWSALGTGCDNRVHGLAVRAGGDVIAVGAFDVAGGVAARWCARWTGAAWASMGANTTSTNHPRTVLALPNGDVVVGHGFTPLGDNESGISRWNGTTWSGLGTGLRATMPPTDDVDVRTIVQRADGALVVGGMFSVAGNVVAGNLAVTRSDCMPSVASYGTGCTGPAGPLSITADALPWIGSPFRTTTSGVPLGALCLGVIGLQQVALPLDQLLPEGQPGCSLLATLDILLLLTNGIGTAHSTFSLANDPSLLGVPFFQQTIPLSFDAFGALVAVRGSNALALVIGTL